LDKKRVSCTDISTYCFLKGYPINATVLKIVTVMLLLVVAACSSTTGPVVIRESSSHVMTSKDDGSVGVDSKSARLQPVAPNRTLATIPVVEKLIVQSNFEARNKNYEQAINLAERGLRINRKEPRLYLALSKACKGGGNRQQSVYFARQGLRYAKRGSDVYRSLTALSK
jgi:Flp pilus assembly protein TadD